MQKKILKCTQFGLLGSLMIMIGVVSGCRTFPYNHDGLDVAEKYYYEKNYSQAYETLIPLADDGNSVAQYAIGYMYFYGLGVSQDENFARYWIEQSAKQNYPSAVESLKIILEDANYQPSDIPA